MKKIIFLLLLPFASFAQSTAADPSFGGQVEVVGISFIDSLKNDHSDTTYVINFWATWCAPCIKELPAFEALNEEVAGRKIKVILISLDFQNQLNERVIPFVKAKQMKSKVVLLSEPDPNAWIDKVDKSWSGGIPSTLIINAEEKRHDFYEKEFTLEELNKLLNL